MRGLTLTQAAVGGTERASDGVLVLVAINSNSVLALGLL